MAVPVPSLPSSAPAGNKALTQACRRFTGELIHSRRAPSRAPPTAGVQVLLDGGEGDVEACAECCGEASEDRQGRGDRALLDP
ncbi:hypothetical protein GCM10009646_34660 [Streptomyces aureus]